MPINTWSRVVEESHHSTRKFAENPRFSRVRASIGEDEVCWVSCYRPRPELLLWSAMLIDMLEGL